MCKVLILVFLFLLLTSVFLRYDVSLLINYAEKGEAVYRCCRMVWEWIGLCGQISVSCPGLSCLWMV